MGLSGSWIIWMLCACCTALETAALRVTMRESSLKVVQGDYVVLPCSFFTSSPLSRLNIIWTLAPFSGPESPTQVIVYDHGQVIEDPGLIGRVGFTGVPWSADIFLNDTRVSDAGIYRCLVNNPPEMANSGISELELKVLTPPSPPLCHWDGDADAGGSVTLSCSVEEGVPTPEIHWEKLEPEKTALPVNMEGALSGFIQIFNVSSQTSGLYRCSATNVLGTENCYLSLSIRTAPGHSSGVLQGVLLTLSMCLVLLALVLLMLWLRRTGQDGWRWRDGKEEECYNKIRYTSSLRSFV